MNYGCFPWPAGKRDHRPLRLSRIDNGYGRMHPSITCAEPNIAFDRTEERSPSGGVPPRQLPMRADDVAGVAVGKASKIFLVPGLRPQKIARGKNPSHPLARPNPGALN